MKMKNVTKCGVLDSISIWKNAIGILLILTFMLLTVKPALADVVNINKANSEALQQNLQGIGPVKADAIVEYRNKNGSFKSIDDLKNVPGIGDELVNKNSKNISTSRGLSKAKDSKQAESSKGSNKGSKDKSKNDDMDDEKRSKDKKLKKNKEDKKGKTSKKDKDGKKSKKSKKDKDGKKSKKSKKGKDSKKAKKSKKGKDGKKSKKSKKDKK